MRTNLILFLLGILVSCSQVSTVDPEFQPMVEEFKNISNRKDSSDYDNISIEFADIDREGVVGTCWNYGIYKKIKIDRGSWRYYDIFTRYSLVWHELSHCICLSGHSDRPNPNRLNFFENIYYIVVGWFKKEKKEYFDDGCPVSWMHSTIAPTSCSYAHYNEYVEDIRVRCQK